jgi:histone deacetylase complex regulatory component SIN3
LYEQKQEAIEGMFKNPVQVIPIILNRAKNKQEHFIQKYDSLNKEWKEQIEKKWSKSLDHQSYNFK